MNRSSYCLLCATVALTFSPWTAHRARAEDLPNPKALLQGVEAARLRTPPSRLWLEVVYREPDTTSKPNLFIEFQGDARRFVKSNVGPEVRILYVGTNVFLFDGGDSLTVRDITMTTSDYCFDPRILGITTSYSWQESLAKNLPYRDATSMETLGREPIDGKAAWHVRAIDSYRQKIDLWIDDQNGFKVYRYDFSIPGVTNSTRSHYDNAQYPWLPTRMVTQYSERYDTIHSERLLSLVKAEADVRFDESTWTLAGLKPPVGTSVSDLRTRKGLGYWDGTAVSRHPPRPMPDYAPVKPWSP